MSATPAPETPAAALARLYDLDLSEDPGDLDLYLALAARTDGPIVELACGSGRLAVPLAAAGHAVTGVDLDPAMLERARTAAAAAGPAAARRLTLVEGDLLDVPTDQAGRFGLAILGLNSILLLGERARQRAAIGSMAARLAPGGRLVVDAWLPTVDDVARFDGRLSLEWVRREPASGRDVVKLAAAWLDPVARRLTLSTIFDEASPGGTPVRWTRTDELRLVTPDELVDDVAAAGLELEAIGGDHDLAPLDPGSERVVVVARRPA